MSDIGGFIGNDTEITFGTVTPPTFLAEDNDTYIVSSDGTSTSLITETWKYDLESSTWVQLPTGGTTCPAPMTRNALLALRNSGSLNKDCHYVITNPNSQGNLTAQKIILHAVDEKTLSTNVSILTTHDLEAWSGTYDISVDRTSNVEDNLNNIVNGWNSIQNFPWGVTQVANNKIDNVSFVYNGGTVEFNEMSGNPSVTVNSGVFSYNTVATDANITINSGNVRRNHFEAQSNTTITSSDFFENRVETDATVNSTTTGDVDNNVFRSLSVSNISGTSNVDAVEIKQNGNLTISGGNLADSTIGEDAEVTLVGQSNYENVWGASVVFRQVGTGYIRYSTFEGTTTWTNGNVNLSNVSSYVSTVNTTGSAGTISNSRFNRIYGNLMRNVGSLTITDCDVSNYGQLSINNATRLYMYRSTVTDGSRVLISSGSRIDMSYTNLDSYSYVQSTGNGGILYANYCNLSSLGYIRNTTTNTNRANRTNVTSQANVRFDGNVSGCRVYYSNVSGGASIYHSGNSINCYMYYCESNSLGQIYTQNSTNARIYYSSATSRGYLRSLNASATHYMYYCNVSASGYIQFNNGTGRFYGVDVSSQSILEKRGLGGNIYYSAFSAYYYAYITRTGGTSSGLYGMGRRSHTITNPVSVAPYNQGAAWQNF